MILPRLRRTPRPGCYVPDRAAGVQRQDSGTAGRTENCSDTFPISAGEQRADALITELAGQSWQRLSVGAGAHGPREYHWARIRIAAGAKPGHAHWLLARRSLHDPGEIAYYACYGPARSRVVDLAWAAGDPGQVLAWSNWRRKRQYQARISHYRRRGYELTQLPLQY